VIPKGSAKRYTRIFEEIFMKKTFLRTLVAVLCAFCATAYAQTLSVTRDPAAYHPESVLFPETLLSPDNFKNIASGEYVVVEGYIDYHATAWPEKDGDYHFEMQSTDKEHTLNPIDGLVCEIDPVLRLKGAEALKDIDQHDQSTYRKARVYGWLRFGTERNHAGVQDYDVGNGKIVNGHWEIHPVEKVETIDDKEPFKIGPEAEYVKPPSEGKGSIKERYKINDEHFPKGKGQFAGSNYARIIGNVKQIRESPNQSGDLDVDFEVDTKTYTATIPQYYVESFDSETQTVKFFHLLNFESIGYSLKPSDTETLTFYGLRNWTFSDGEMTATLAPVEMIK
jgi:hypothetical protein